MMGEFLPVLYIILTHVERRNKNHKTHVQVVMSNPKYLDSPLNSFYKEIEGIYDNKRLTIEVTPTERAIKACKSVHTYSSKDYHRWDWQWGHWDWTDWVQFTPRQKRKHIRDEQKRLLYVVKTLKDWARKGLHTSTSDTDTLTCIFQIRQDAENSKLVRYLNSVSDKDSGQKRRCIVNLRKLATEVKESLTSDNKHIKVQIVSDDGNTLKQQIRTYLDAHILVLGHGAGCLHTIWMQPNCRVLELISEMKSKVSDGAVNGLMRMSRFFGFDLQRMVVNSEICTLDPKGASDMKEFVEHAFTSLSGPSAAQRRRPPTRATTTQRRKGSPSKSKTPTTTGAAAAAKAHPDTTQKKQKNRCLSRKKRRGVS